MSRIFLVTWATAKARGCCLLHGCATLPPALSIQFFNRTAGTPAVHRSFWILIGYLLINGCASGPEVDSTIHQTDKGAVYLERIADRSFQAAHPIKLELVTVARVLHGVMVKDEQDFLQTMVAGTASVSSAFSDEEVGFLAPLIAEGLTKAAPDQQVGFRIVQTGAPVYSQTVGGGVGSSEPPLHLSPSETTSGAVYAYGRSLYLTITQLRHRAERPDTINMANRRLPDLTGLAKRDVLFLPESARRPDSYRGQNSTDATLVIDYELLSALPLSSTPPASAAQSQAPTKSDGQSFSPVQSITGPAKPPEPSGAEAQELQTIKEQINKKDTEVEALRKELQDIKRQLAEQEAERDTLKRKGKSAPKHQESAR
ncbi:MAG: hypothetical protein ACT4OO_08245 [Nitrospiraceae bacterium]